MIQLSFLFLIRMDKRDSYGRLERRWSSSHFAAWTHLTDLQLHLMLWCGVQACSALPTWVFLQLFWFVGQVCLWPQDQRQTATHTTKASVHSNPVESSLRLRLRLILTLPILPPNCLPAGLQAPASDANKCSLADNCLSSPPQLHRGVCVSPGSASLVELWLTYSV